MSRPFTICIAGAESTGKSSLVDRLAAHFKVKPVHEYARDYCAQQGNYLSMHQLVHVAMVQEQLIRDAIENAAQSGAPVVITDTDAVTSAAWAMEGWGRVDQWFEQPRLPIDLTLVTENDVSWVNDGVRIQAQQRRRDRFRQTLVAELEKRGRRWLPVGGTGTARFNNALSAIAPLLRPA